jgi:hypothetical protein
MGMIGNSHRWSFGPGAKKPQHGWGFSGADDGIRTRDPHLGKVMLYQLSHVRETRSRLYQRDRRPQR